jgi:hypothetical protein
MIFELDSRENDMIFPCSICKKNTQSAKVCHDTCGFYVMSNMEIFDLKNDVQKFINEYCKHPKID